MKCRVSEYLSYKKLKNKKYLVFNGLTLAFDIIDSETVLILKSLGLKWHNMEYFKKLLPEKIINRLIKRGYITALTPEEIERRINEYFERSFSARLFNFILIPTYACNLRCSYCFELDIIKSKKTEKLLNLEQIEQIFKIIADNQNSFKNQKHMPDITLYGGEPFLPSNKNIVAEIFKKARKLPKLTSVSVITNGTTILDYISILKENKDIIGGIQVTLDGPKEIHDKRRVGPGLRKTFDLIVSGIDKLLDLGIRVNVRMNVDKDTVRFIPDLVCFFEQKGWLHNKNFLYHYYPVMGPHFFTNLEAIRDFQKQKNYFKEDNIEPKFFVLREDNTQRIFKREKDFFMSPLIYYCGAGISNLILDPYGKIYTCFETVGRDDESVVGTYDNRGIHFNDNWEKWHKRNSLELEECRSCKLRFLCGGGCASQAYKYKGSYFLPYCEIGEGKLKELWEVLLEVSNEKPKNYN